MKKFKTESKRLLDLMINSIYTNQEIFLRELISNASDAVDKLYFQSLTDKSIDLAKDDLKIFISFDKDARTITVSDNGIGMSKEDLDRNLGTIAHSDSLDFKVDNAEQQGSDIDIIGQFGVGFYSAFMVGKKVRVCSRAYGDEQAWLWESDGIEGYTVKEAQRSEHGTDVIIELKDTTDEEDYDQYLSEYTLRHLIVQYSNYVRYPVCMEVTKSRAVEKPEDAGEDWKPEFEQYTEVETINSMIPIWKRRKSEVSQEEYNEFYKQNFHDFADPARTVSIHAEGALSYDALLFVPSRAPYDLYSKDYKKGLALYSSNVLIMEKCEELLPDYFNFVRGVVDSQDLSLNISRETLQHNSQLRAIANRVEKKVAADLLSMLKDDREAYESFFENFGRGLKFGIYSSYGAKKDELADLLLFYSAKQKKMQSLEEYLATMQPEQESVYYAAGDSRERLEKMPIVTSVLERGYDVLLCTQDIDEFCISAMVDYKENQFKNVAGGDLGLESEEEKAAAEEVAKENEALFATIQNALGDKVAKVAVSTRLSAASAAPACVTAEGALSLEMEKILSQQPGAEELKSQRVLELNSHHPVFEVLRKAQADKDDDKIKLYGEILYNQALLVEGLSIDDPVAYAQSIAQLMK